MSILFHFLFLNCAVLFLTSALFFQASSTSSSLAVLSAVQALISHQVGVLARRVNFLSKSREVDRKKICGLTWGKKSPEYGSLKLREALEKKDAEQEVLRRSLEEAETRAKKAEEELASLQQTSQELRIALDHKSAEVVFLTNERDTFSTILEEKESALQAKDAALQEAADTAALLTEYKLCTIFYHPAPDLTYEQIDAAWAAKLHEDPKEEAETWFNRVAAKDVNP